MRAPGSAGRLLSAGALLAAALATSPANAKGLAIVVAPEAGIGTCFAETPQEGFACATERCMAESGLTKKDCVPVNWCFGNGFSGDIFLQTADGFHFHRYLCDAQSMDELAALVDAICTGSDTNDFLECSLVRYWDRDGEEHAVEPGAE